MKDIVRTFAEQHFGRSSVYRLKAEDARGGSEAQEVRRIHVYASNGRQSGRFIVKMLQGFAVREYEIYKALTADSGVLAPRMLGWRRTGPEAGYLFLEWIQAASRWPWRDPVYASHVLRQLAHLHRSEARLVSPALHRWDYESDLHASAQITADLYRSLFETSFRIGGRPMVRPMERFSEALPEIRKRLRGFLGTTILHGDVHPGNIVIRAQHPSISAVLIDWGRARSGSPLEDVCSWLHSLGFWEPEARRVHDTLLKVYFEACGGSRLLTRSLREACWLAGACNALAGALRYHLAVANDPDRAARVRATSVRAAADWLRIIRRADIIWRS